MLSLDIICQDRRGPKPERAQRRNEQTRNTKGLTHQEGNDETHERERQKHQNTLT
jgi:hypothetical protein